MPIVAEKPRYLDGGKDGPLMTNTSGTAAGDRRTDRNEDLVWWATWIGLLIVAAGLIAGLVTALDKEEVDCPNGKVFSGRHNRLHL